MPKTQSWPYDDSTDPNDPEFEAYMRSLVGEPFGFAIDKERAQSLQYPEWQTQAVKDGRLKQTTYGRYVKPNQPAGGLEQLQKHFDQNYVGNPQAEEDMVYGIGPNGNTRGTYAHEFRHRAHSMPNPPVPVNELRMPAWFLMGRGSESTRKEGFNRLMDAYFSGSRKDWKNAIEGWRSFNKIYLDVELDNEQAEKDLVSNLTQVNERWTNKDKVVDDYVTKPAEPGVVDRAIGMLSKEQATKNEAARMARQPWKLWAKVEKEE